MLIVFALLASASAVEASTPEARAFSPREVLVRAGISLAGEPWPEELVADLAAGLEALPEAFRRSPGKPLTLELHPEPSAFGMGDGSSKRPEWTDGFERFHLYAFEDTTEPRAAYRLESLTRSQKHSLWRRRAIVHAVIRRLDARNKWSDEESWRRIVGWLSPFDRPLTFTTRPLIDYPWAFSRARGMASPALDLATFAEEAFVPAESFGHDLLASDDRVRCQEFSKSRVLAGFLTGGGTLAPLAPEGCDAFDEWAAFDSFSHVEVLFSAPSGSRPQSLFGHVSLRLARKASTLVRGPGKETIVELAALTGPAEGGAKYLLKGLGGKFKAVFSTSSLAGLLKQNLEIEQRSIHRYRVELTREESLRTLRRVWELERRGYVDYYFFSENCAQMLVFLLDSVMEPDSRIESPGKYIAFPSSALDALAAVTVTRPGADSTFESRPLLTPLSPDFASSLDLAKEAEIERGEVLDRLVESMPAKQAAQWREVHAKLRRSNPDARRAVYETQLGGMIERALSDDPRRLPLLHAYVAACTRIERHALDVLDAERANIDLRRLLLPEDVHVPTTEEMILERQASFEREDTVARNEAEMTRTMTFHSLLLTTPRREPAKKEAKVIAAAEKQRKLFVASLALHGRLVDLAGAAPARPSPYAPEESSPEPTPADERWQQASGRSRLAVGLGVAGSDTDTLSPALTWRTALLADALGEARQRGIGASSELRVLDVKSTWALGLGWPEHLRTDVAAIAFRSVQRPPRTLWTSVFDWLGWGWDIQFRFRSDRPQPLRATVAAELIAPVYLSDSAQSHTLFALGVAPEVRAQWLPKAFALGPRARLSHRTHFGGGHPNALRLELQYEPRWTLGSMELWQAWSARLAVSRLFFGRVSVGVEAEASLDLESEVALPYGAASVVAEW